MPYTNLGTSLKTFLVSLPLSTPSLELDLVLGARGFHVSNPPMLQNILLKASLGVFSQTSMEQLCFKSRLLTGYLEMLIEQSLVKEKVASRKKSEDGDKGEPLSEHNANYTLHFSMHQES